MTIEVLPVFTIPPDWATPVRESLEWKTNIMQSQIGVEQRVATRLAPRRRMEVTFTSIGREHSYLEQLLSIEPQGRYYVPVQFERGFTDTAIGTGDTTGSIASLGREFLDTKFIILLGKKPHQYEIVEISSAAVVGTHTEFTFAAAVVGNWPIYTMVCPCRSAIIEANNVAQFTRAGARILQGSVRFLFDVAYDWVTALSPPTFLGQPVLELISNEADQQGGTFERLYAAYDGGSGPVFQTDLSGRAFPTYSSSNWIQGRPANEALRDMLFFLRGRQVHAWWVHPIDDFVATEAITGGDGHITVERAGVADFGVSTSRQYVRIMTHAGVAYYRQLLGGTNVDDDTETLTLDSAIPDNIALGDIASIRYMGQGRLDQDLISIDHITDQEGISQYTLGIKLLGELRTATDWNPPALADPNMHPDTCLLIDNAHYLGPPPTGLIA